jgi:hypothetical protein
MAQEKQVERFAQANRLAGIRPEGCGRASAAAAGLAKPAACSLLAVIRGLLDVGQVVAYFGLIQLFAFPTLFPCLPIHRFRWVSPGRGASWS